jgi:hypothetical protein
MDIIDFHTHYVKREMLNPTWLNFLESINPEFYAKIDDFSDRPQQPAAPFQQKKWWNTAEDKRCSSLLPL